MRYEDALKGDGISIGTTLEGVQEFTPEHGDFYFLAESVPDTKDFIYFVGRVEDTSCYSFLMNCVYVLKPHGFFVAPNDFQVEKATKKLPFVRVHPCETHCIIERLPISCDGGRFKHSGARGDIVYGLTAVKALGGGELFLNPSGKPYKGAAPDWEELSQFSDLLQNEAYVSVSQWKYDTEVDYDLDSFREVGTSYNLLSRGHLMRFGARLDLSEPWITGVEANEVAPIVVGRSARYHAPFDWGELKCWQRQCVFVGSPREHEEFTSQTGLEIRLHPTSTYLELAQVIKGSKLFVGNQSFPYSLAEAMQCNRVLEQDQDGPNCVPQGRNGFTRLTQTLIENIMDGFIPFRDRHAFRRNRMTIREHSVSPRLSGLYSTPYEYPPVTYLLTRACRPLEEAAKADGAEVIVVETDGIFDKAMNIAAEEALAPIICIVDVTKCDYATASQVAAALKGGGGIASMWMEMEPYPYVTGFCLAVTKKSWEECGLFLISVPESTRMLEMNLRYTNQHYAIRHIGRKSEMPKPEPCEYVTNVYGVKI